MTTSPAGSRPRRLRDDFATTCLVALAFGLSALIAAASSGTLAITLAAVGGAATLWLLQTTLVGLSDFPGTATGPDPRDEGVAP